MGWPGMRFELRDFLAPASSGGGPPPPAHRFAAVIDKAGIWDWLGHENPPALPRLLEAVREALSEQGLYVISTKQTPRELQKSLRRAGVKFAVDASFPLSGGLAWAYVLMPS